MPQQTNNSLVSLQREVQAKLQTYKNIIGSKADYDQVPKLHWCKNYYDPIDKSKKIIIPDGNDCCFWHWIGLPVRYGLKHPAYPYQEVLFNEYYKEQIRLYYMGKPPKIGASQTWLQIALHEAITNPKWKNGQVAIVVGTGGNEAEHMIDRCKELLAYRDKRGIPLRDSIGKLITKLPINEDYNTRKEFSINSVEFRAHPANNVNSIRSQPNMRMILIDEIAFFKMVEQQDVRDAFEHYLVGSEVIIVLITTAGKTAGGVAYEIETEEPTIYTRHLYDYKIGLAQHPESKTTLYQQKDIDIAKHERSWNRNFLRIWGHGEGNIFNSETLDKLSNTSYQMPQKVTSFPNVLAIDPAYGKQRTKTSSKFGAVGGWKGLDGNIYIRSWFELEESAEDDANNRVNQEIEKYGYTNLIIDAQWTGIVNTFRKRKGIHAYGVDYGAYGLKMIDKAADTVQDMKIFFQPNHDEIITQMKAVRRGDNGLPDKKLSRYDAGDCVSQLVWHFEGKNTMHMKMLKGKF